MPGGKKPSARDKSPRRGERRRPALLAPFRTLRNIGLIGVWGIALLCGWHAGGGSWSGDAPGQFDLLSAALRGALVWLGLTTIWLGGFGLCQRIIQDAGIQALRERAGVDSSPPEHLNIGTGRSDA